MPRRSPEGLMTNRGRLGDLLEAFSRRGERPRAARNDRRTSLLVALTFPACFVFGEAEAPGWGRLVPDFAKRHARLILARVQVTNEPRRNPSGQCIGGHVGGDDRASRNHGP